VGDAAIARWRSPDHSLSVLLVSTHRGTRIAGGLAAFVTICAALLCPGCKEEERPAPTPAAPIPTAVSSAAGAREDPEIAARKYELTSSALALKAKALEAGEGDLARACAALEATRGQDCQAVKRAAENFREAKAGLRGDVPKMLGDNIERTERAVAALCP
jgi:hypothetical protein